MKLAIGVIADRTDCEGDAVSVSVCARDVTTLYRQLAFSKCFFENLKIAKICWGKIIFNICFSTEVFFSSFLNSRMYFQITESFPKIFFEKFVWVKNYFIKQENKDICFLKLLTTKKTKQKKSVGINQSLLKL